MNLEYIPKSVIQDSETVTMDPDNFWQLAAKWTSGALATLATLFVTFVWSWVNNRLKSAETKIAEQKERSDRQDKTIAEHDKTLGQIDVHLSNIKTTSSDMGDSIRRLHEKFDKYIING
jgi:septal ring factor EnvC (AmiA/AmiB activator)